jgi:hypothetical protein
MAKIDKTCIVCGNGFKGTAKAEVCGATCRKRLSRLKAEGKEPPFKLIGGKNSGNKKSAPQAKKVGRKESQPPAEPPKQDIKPVHIENRYLSERFKMKMGIK